MATTSFLNRIDFGTRSPRTLADIKASLARDNRPVCDRRQVFKVQLSTNGAEWEETRWMPDGTSADNYGTLFSWADASRALEQARKFYNPTDHPHIRYRVHAEEPCRRG